MSQRAFVGLGSNVGDRLRHLQFAVDRLGKLGKIASVSPVYQSAAHTLDATPQPDFLNAVVEIGLEKDLPTFLRQIRQIEIAAGRFAPAARPRWQPRTLDLDILTFGLEIVNSPELSVPHPRLPERRFVLQPLLDIAPGLAIPGLGKTVDELLAECPDRLPCERIPDILHH